MLSVSIRVGHRGGNTEPCLFSDGMHHVLGIDFIALLPHPLKYIYDALSECGRADLAYRLLTESTPGYKTWFEHGATTLWECWDGENRGSHNHHMFSGVIAWFYKSLLGIRPIINAPGFTELELCPSFIADIGFVRGYTDTVRGRIEASYTRKNDGFLYSVTLPEGIRASYAGEILHAGENRFFVKAARGAGYVPSP